MTGFARAGETLDTLAWTWEIKSVNARGLDVRLRLPPGLDQLEPPVRERVGRACARGTVSIALDLKRGRAASAFRVNEPALAGLLALQAALGPRVDQAPPRLETLLGVRGLIEEIDADMPAIDDAARPALLASFDRALEAFATARRGEGGRLAAVVAGHVDAIARLTEEAAQLAALQPEAIAARLKRQVASLLEEQRAQLPPERLAAEVALIASRADVAEELDRLRAHVAAARELLSDGGAIGRKLDFLAQEFNREANTLTSKSADIEVTRCGLALKNAIDQLREQVQNIE
ncbi:MAG TPA: YicC/YloC family endoribonuclease [Candidatus Sulfotelmatobacter sp.]|nr:YicC/YloC family endoribonuclease [Candidatus Sulfotelmatobacter sp.]